MSMRHIVEQSVRTTVVMEKSFHPPGMRQAILASQAMESSQGSQLNTSFQPCNTSVFTFFVSA